MNEQKNLFLAIGISIVIIVFFQVLFPTQPIERTQDLDKEILAPATSIDGNKASNLEVIKPKEEVLTKSERITIENPSLTGSINLTGAVLDNLNLSKYKISLEENSNNIELLLPDGTSNPYYIEFGWKEIEGNNIKFPDLNTKWSTNSSTLTPSNPVTLQWTNDSNITFLLNFSIDKDYMLITVTPLITEDHNGVRVGL